MCAAAVLKSAKPGDPAKNFVVTRFSYICQKWPDAGHAGVGAEMRCLPLPIVIIVWLQS